jgi:hypothetical protein
MWHKCNLTVVNIKEVIMLFCNNDLIDIKQFYRKQILIADY